jgi:GDP-L-fucose synthase
MIPYQFVYGNMQIQNNLIDTALQSGVEKFIFWEFLHLSKLAPQPLQRRVFIVDGITNEW